MTTELLVFFFFFLEEDIESNAPSQGSIRAMRDVHLNAIYRAVRFVSSDEFEDTDLETLRAKLDRLEESWKKFEREINRIMIQVSAEEQENEEQCFIHGEGQYVRARAAICSKINERREPTAAVPAAQVVRVQLSDLEVSDKLPEFDGDETQWASFKGAFIADVDQNPNLTDVKKLRKLLSAVKGAAERSLGPWAVRAENYPLAWKKLCSDYDDDYKAIRAHIKQLFALPFAQQASSSNIKLMIDTLSAVKRQLQMLAEGGDVSEYIMIYMMEDRLDALTRDAWNYHRSVQRRPSLDDFIEFLGRKANSFIDHEPPAKRARVESPRYEGGRNKPSTSKGFTAPRETAGSSTFGRKRASCRFCRGDHMLYHCKDFSVLPIEKRKEFIAKGQLCENCFRFGHTNKSCWSAGCPKCSGNPKHNSCLCPSAEKERTQRSSVLFCGTDDDSVGNGEGSNQRSICAAEKTERNK